MGHPEVKWSIVIFIIIIIGISFMHGIYTYIPETKYAPREYSVAAILLLQFMVLISLIPVLTPLYLLLLLLLLFTAIDFSLGGNNPYDSTDKQIIINIHKRKSTNNKNTVHILPKHPHNCPNTHTLQNPHI